MSVRLQSKVLIVLGMGVLLAGCGGGKLLGSRAAPDETQVVDGPTLVLPPNYDLRPPRQATDYEASLKASSQARALVTGQEAPLNANVSATSGDDQWLLQKAGTTQASGDIRTKLEQDAEAEKQQKQAEKKTVLEKWFSSSPSDSDSE